MRCYGISFSLLEMSFYVQKESQSKPSILQYMFDMDFILISFCQTLQKIGSSFQLQWMLKHLLGCEDLCGKIV